MIPPPRAFYLTISQLQYVGIWILLFQGHPLISGAYTFINKNSSDFGKGFAFLYKHCQTSPTCLPGVRGVPEVRGPGHQHHLQAHRDQPGPATNLPHPHNHI